MSSWASEETGGREKKKCVPFTPRNGLQRMDSNASQRSAYGAGGLNMLVPFQGNSRGKIAEAMNMVEREALCGKQWQSWRDSA